MQGPMQQPRRITRARIAAPSAVFIVLLLLYLSPGSCGAARFEPSAADLSSAVRRSGPSFSRQLVDLEALSGSPGSLSDDEPSLWSPAAAGVLGLLAPHDELHGTGEGPDFDLAEARIYARLSSIAYCNAEDSTTIGL